MPSRNEALRVEDNKTVMPERFGHHQVPLTVGGPEKDRNNVKEPSLGKLIDSESHGKVKHLRLDDDDDTEESSIRREMQRRGVGVREKKQRLCEQERQSMAKFAKRQGLQLMKELEKQRMKQQRHPVHKQESCPEDARSKVVEATSMEEEKNRIPEEKEKMSSSSGHGDHHFLNSRSAGRDLEQQQTPLSDSQIDAGMKTMVTEPPLKVLDWLLGDTDDEKCILVSEDRTLSLLHAINDHNGELRNSITSLPEDWVPIERLKEAEQRSTIAEERLHHLEELWNSSDGMMERRDEELRALMAMAREMDRHFAQMRKFTEERLSEMKKVAVMERGDGGNSNLNSNSKAGNREKSKWLTRRREMEEHENHRKRVAHVFAMYNELLRLIKVEHAKRLDAEHKSNQLTSQLRRQTGTLKLAEKVVKHTAASASSPCSPVFPPSGKQSPSFKLSSLIHSFDDDDEQNLNLTSPRSSSTSKQQQRCIHQKFQVPRADSSLSSTHLPSVRKRLTYDRCDFPQASPRDNHLHRSISDLHLISKHGTEEEAEEPNNSSKHLEAALMGEVKSKGLADVDVFSEKKTVGKEKTSWEYKHSHFDFNNRPHSPPPSLMSSSSSPLQAAAALRLSPLSSREEILLADPNRVDCGFPRIAEKKANDPISGTELVNEERTLSSTTTASHSEECVENNKAASSTARGKICANPLEKEDEEIRISARSDDEEERSGDGGECRMKEEEEEEAEEEGQFMSCEETWVMKGHAGGKRGGQQEAWKKLLKKSAGSTTGMVGKKRRNGGNGGNNNRIHRQMREEEEHGHGDEDRKLLADLQALTTLSSSSSSSSAVSYDLHRRLAAVEASYSALVLIVKVLVFVSVVAWIDFPAFPWSNTAPPT